MNTLFNLVLSFYFLLTPLYSVSAPPFPFEVEQPDGSKISVRLFGSEYYNLMETEDGYVIDWVEDDERLGWYYSELDEDGKFVFSDIFVTYPASNDLHIPKHLREISPIVRTLNYHPSNKNSFQHDNLQRGILDSTLKPLVLLVEFEDERNTYSPENFANLLFAENLSPDNTYFPSSHSDYKMSVREYYDEISNGKQKIIGDLGSVTDWETASNDYSYYVDGANGTGKGTNGVSQSAAALIVEIAMKIDEEGFDFTQFDNGEGAIDVVILIVAGKGGNMTSNYFWPHMFVVPTSGYGLEEIDQNAPSNSAGYFSPGSNGGVAIRKYIVIQEKYAWNHSGTHTGFIHPIGTICHELGHVLGLPDLYNTSIESDPGIGDWGLMGSGNYLQQNSPAYMSAWSRYRLGYIDPFIIENVTAAPEAILPAAIGSSEQTAMILPMNTNMPQEYLIIENRQNMGSDQYLETSGLVVWQIDETITDMYPAVNSVNVNSAFYGVNFLQAGMTTLIHPYTYSYDRDGDGEIEYGSNSNIEIDDINEDSDGIITFMVKNLNHQGKIIGYDEGNYEGSGFSDGSSLVWAGIRFTSPEEVYLSGVKTVFPSSDWLALPPEIDPPWDVTDYSIKIWQGWTNGKPLLLIEEINEDVAWSSTSSSQPYRDGGWVFISLIDKKILLKEGEEYYIEINFNGEGGIYTFNNGTSSASSASDSSYWRSNQNDTCLPLKEIINSQGELLAENGDWNIRAVLSGSNEILSSEFNFVPQKHEIYSNYPNPFNPVTMLSIYLANPSAVSYTVFDLRGRQIIHKEFTLLGGGRHEFEVNMAPNSSGVYFYQFTINDQEYSSQKMVMLK